MSDLLALGTPVRIIGGYDVNTTGTIERAYRIRFGHPMYDIRTTYGRLITYYAQSQIEVMEPEAPPADGSQPREGACFTVSPVVAALIHEKDVPGWSIDPRREAVAADVKALQAARSTWTGPSGTVWPL